MAERVYPASKPNPYPPKTLNGAAAAAAAGAINGAGRPPAFPATKAQMYGATRPTYRPQPPKRRRRRRGCCCACFLWLTLLLLALLLLAAIAGGVFYVLYRPHRPTFTVSSLRLSALNVTASGQLTSHLDLSVTARNPNRKVAFLYGPASISVSSGDASIGDGSLPAFVHDAGNTTVLRAAVSATGQSLDASVASDLMKKNSLPLKIEVETSAGVKIGALKTKKIGITVSCDGINVAVPKAKAKATASSPDARCKVKLRIKIWKWTI